MGLSPSAVSGDPDPGGRGRGGVASWRWNGETIGDIQATEAAPAKLGARGISEAEAKRLLNNAYVIAKSLSGRAARREPKARRALIGLTDGGRALTLVIQETPEPQQLADHHRLELDGARA